MSSRPGEYEVFWGEISPCDHLVQIYDEDTALLDALGGFIGGGLRSGDSAVVIATPTHLDSLGKRLHSQGLDVDAARSDDRYLALDAEHALCHTEAFTLLCAYPRTGFTQDASDSLRDICAAHSKIVGRPN